MTQTLEEMRRQALTAVAGAHTAEELEAVRVQVLGRKSGLSQLLAGIGQLPAEQRGAAGKAVNEAKREISESLEARAAALERARLGDLARSEWLDMTFPARRLSRGHGHPLVAVQQRLERILATLGYHVEEGPEVETDWFNFEALNLPRGHAARDAQDSFFFTDDLLLRTHTSPVQIRAMQRLGQPPIYVIAPGRVYRRDATDATHLACFLQLEGLAVDRDLSVGDLKGTLLYMLQGLYGPDRRVRFRANFFPFTEPSFEFDVSCGICGGAGCRACGQEGWLEVGGCGMVHPQVLRNGGIDPETFGGFAWGFGIERIAAQLHGVEDIRAFYDNDLRFLEQL